MATWQPSLVVLASLLYKPETAFSARALTLPPEIMVTWMEESPVMALSLETADDQLQSETNDHDSVNSTQACEHDSKGLSLFSASRKHQVAGKS